MAIASVLSTLQASAIENPYHFLAAVGLLTPILYVILNEFVRSAARVKGMKGPAGWPLIGNLWHIRTNAAEQYRTWSKTHGAVYQIQLGNIPVVVVNSAASAKVIFGQNAQALSSRPEFYTFHKVSFDIKMPFMTLADSDAVIDRFQHRRDHNWHFAL
jgi:3-hydroxyphenylacetate 6-hydroxylase